MKAAIRTALILLGVAIACSLAPEKQPKKAMIEPCPTYIQDRLDRISKHMQAYYDSLRAEGKSP